MPTSTRDQLKKIFKKVKHLRLPKELETMNFEPLQYFGWLDEVEDVYYTIAEIDGKLEGIKWEITRPGDVGVKLGLCEICKQHKPLGEIALVAAKTRTLPKHVSYRTRGNYICMDNVSCHERMESREGLEWLFKLLLE